MITLKIFLKAFLVLIAFSISTNQTVGQSGQPSSKIWTTNERELLIRELERTKSTLINEIKDLSEQQWNFKEDPSRWSIGEVVEHLFAQNESYRIEMRTALSQPELNEFVTIAKGNDEVFINYTTDTLKADAGFLSPIGRFGTRDKATFAFIRTHDAIIKIIATTDKDFRKHFAFRNYVFDGKLSHAEKYNVRDMHQLMLTCIAHMDRHINQIRRIKQHPNYPKQ